MRRICAVFLIGVCLIASTTAQDEDEMVDLNAKAARITRAAALGRLTGPSQASRGDIVAGFLRARHGHDQQTAGSLELVAEHPSSVRVHLRFRQRIAGLDVYGTYVKATVTPSGELLSVVENLAPVDPQLSPASVDYRDALSAALRRRYPGQPSNLQEVGSLDNSVTYARGNRFYEDPNVTRVAVPMKSRRLRVGYLVETWDQQNQLWHTIVSGSGRVLFEELRTASDQYSVFFTPPSQSSQQLLYGPGSGYPLSPVGWKSGNTTTGNNVDAYLDRDADNVADVDGRPIGDLNGDFLTAAQLAQAPTTASNQLVSVTNLFFLTNFAHDFLYLFGFTEAAGNFQTDNFGKGGLGNDSLRAEAQDGAGVNNANFATPSDGSRPLMQMYLWNRSTPQRDGSLDADIVYHEYGHGVTWRMVGGMDGKLAGAIGEGMSDALALYLTLDDAIGEYSSNTPNGIRRARYFTYPHTYSDVKGMSVHNDGEIFAGAMARLLLQWLFSGRDYAVLWLYIIDGLNYTPASPAFEHMRDGLLASMTAFGASQADRCVVWSAFAASGVGYGAEGRVSPNLSITESFALPPECPVAAAPGGSRP